ncbi:MAG: ArsR/SmtB family transcription factor [Thermomicrobiales bacterium]
MDAFTAVADPVRRDILDLLRSGDLEAGSIAARYPISRPAISRHLRVLREAGLVTVRLDGRNRIYRLQPQGLAAVDAWLAPFRDERDVAPLVASEGIWSSRLDALQTEAFRARRDRGRTGSIDKTRDEEQSA